MNLQTYVAANPLPPGTTRWGMPAPAMDCLDYGSYATAGVIAAMLESAITAAGLVVAPGMTAPAVVDGGGTGTMSINDDILAVPPTTPYLPSSMGFFAFSGYVSNPSAISTPGGVIPANTILVVVESLARLYARGIVDAQGVPAGTLGGGIDKNVVVSPSGQRQAVWTNLAFQVLLGGIVQAYWTAPA